MQVLIELQIHLMVVGLSLLVVPRECGLGSATILDVSFDVLSVGFTLIHSCISLAPCPAPQTSHTMRYARRIRHLFGPCGQGESKGSQFDRDADPTPSHCLRTISRP